MCTYILPTQNIVCTKRLFCSVVKIFVHLKFINLYHITPYKTGSKKGENIDRRNFKAKEMVSRNKLPFYVLLFMLEGS